MRRLILPLLLVLVPLAAPASSQAFVTGIGDQQVRMFSSRLFTALHSHYLRLIVPYDVMEKRENYAHRITDTWISKAQSQGYDVHVAFYHSERTPTRLPSVAAYKRDIRAYVRAHPTVTSYEAYNEANRGNARRRFSSPSAKRAAQYYLALRSVCPGCTIVGLDVLDSASVGATVSYIRAFKRAVRGRMPSIWGLHNYTDTNSHRSTGTRAVLRAVPGQVWLTETGGIVKFGSRFPNRHGSGARRAKRALQFMFALARISPRIKRLYVFQFYGGKAREAFDAGLVNPNGTARPGYFVVRRHMTGH